MEERPAQHRQRDVGAAPGLLVEVDLVGQDPALGVETDPVVEDVGVALARGGDVVVAVEDQLHRAVEKSRGEGRGHHPDGGGLLPPEGPAHPADLQLDLVLGDVEDLGDVVVIGPRRLGTGDHLQGVVLDRKGQGPMGLEVVMLLGPAGGAARNDMLTFLKGPLGIPADLDPLLPVDHPPLIGFPGVEDRFAGLDLQLDQLTGGPGGPPGLGHHQRDRLADVLQFILGQEGLVLDDVPDLVLARDVVVGEDRGHVLRLPGGGDVEPLDPAGGHRRGEEHRVE